MATQPAATTRLETRDTLRAVGLAAPPARGRSLSISRLRMRRPQ